MVLVTAITSAWAHENYRESHELMCVDSPMIWLTKFVVRSLELASRRLPSRTPKHLLTGKRGELEAYLHLRTLGYRIVAANFRVPYNRGEIDLIGWDGGVLCFIEVKTRTSADFAPPSTAVDREQEAAHSFCRPAVRSPIARQAGRRRAASISSASFWRETAANPRSACTRARSVGTAAGREDRRGRDFRDRHFWRRKVR